MKLVILWAVVALLSAAAIGSCSINHRSTDFLCERTSQCSTDRVCSDGFCVLRRPVDAGVEIDAPLPPPPPRDAAVVCPEQCTSCDTDAMSCTVDCARGGDVCDRPIVCPEGWTCDIKCTTRGSCNSGIDCTDAKSCSIGCVGPNTCNTIACDTSNCSIDCIGENSCTNVDCGSGKCDLLCTGGQACEKVDCSRACACDVDCGLNDCLGVTCPSEDCTEFFGGCTSRPQGCNLCQ
ncbi:MAG: hypothetical protein H7138_03440 [Myxococcales bacterium]|nr:hypothetical protein [Myxococcales bacterium]